MPDFQENFNSILKKRLFKVSLLAFIALLLFCFITYLLLQKTQFLPKVEVNNSFMNNYLVSIYERFQELDYKGMEALKSNKLNNALSSFKQALILKKEIYTINQNKNPEIATSYRNLGATFYLMGRYDEALEYHRKALEIREKINDYEKISDSYRNIGIVYADRGNLEKALINLKKSLQVIEKALFKAEDPDIKIIYQLKKALIYYDMGKVYKLIGNYKKALKCHERAYTIRKALNADKHDIELSEMAIKEIGLYLGQTTKFMFL